MIGLTNVFSNVGCNQAPIDVSPVIGPQDRKARGDVVARSFTTRSMLPAGQARSILGSIIINFASTSVLEETMQCQPQRDLTTIQARFSQVSDYQQAL